MKLNYLIIGLFGLLPFTSCIQDEAPNAEADIVAVDPAWIKESLENDLLISMPIVENDKVIFLVKKGADLSHLAPKFILTPDASITPANGKFLNFTKPQYYVVTSADGEWKKEYEVSFVSAGAITSYRFEHWEYIGKPVPYQRFYEVSPGDDQKRYIWASGNSGFALTGAAKTSEDYPTVSNDFGVDGKCVKLETKSTGRFGLDVGMPIAAGNLFIGEFNAANAVTSPLKATKFGMPILESKPLALRGYYKYKAGQVFTDKNNSVVADGKDACDIYAVVYETDASSPKLDGSNILSSDRVVCRARIESPGEPSDWTFFDIPFVDMNGKTFDYERLKNNQYNIAIVFSSSIDGAYFNGAVGSTLYIDEVKLVCEDNE